MKSSGLTRPKEKYFLAFFLALLAAAALFVPYMMQDQGYFLFYGDFNVQQVPFYKLAHRAVTEGKFFWSFGTDLGANFIGSYSFYLLGSPFFWLTIPFPNHMVPYLMGPLLILKFACASVAAYAYITRFVKNKQYALLGGLLYAFSGFSVYNVFFNHFHEAIIYFPLLLLSLEWLMTERRHGAFAFMVAMCAIANYYFFFGMVIFTVLYFIIRAASGDWRLFVRGTTGKSIGRLVQVGIEAVLGLLMSAFLLLPAVLAITGNSRIGSFLTGWNGLVYSRPQIYSYIVQCFFFPPDLPARPVFFPDADVKWSSVAGWLPLFGMSGVFAWMMGKHKSWQKRLLTACVVIALVPILNSAFSAFNYSYYARWFYMPLLIMSLITVKGLEDPAVDMIKGWRWSTIVTLAIAIAIGVFPQGQYSDGSFSGFGLYSPDYYDRFMITCAIALGSAIIAGFLIALRKRISKDFGAAAIVLVLVVSVMYSSYFVGTGKTSSYDTNGFIIPHLLNQTEQVTLKDSAGKEKPADTIDDLRVDVYEGMDNVAMFWNMSSINAFHSIVPGSVMEFYDTIGVERTVASRPDMEQYALRSLLSVKYMLDYTDDGNDFADENGFCKLPGWSLYTPDESGTKSTQNGFTVYQNDYYIPYGFTYDSYMTEEFLDKYEEADRAAMMLHAIVLNKEQAKKYGKELQEISMANVVTPGEVDYPFYFQNCRDRAAEACTGFSTDKNGFTATATLRKNNLVFFSIPYDEGWSATVDGEPVPVEKVNIGFMAVPVTGDGQPHEIRFTYRTPGLKFGLLISAGAVLLWVIYLLAAGLTKKKKPIVVPADPVPAVEEGYVFEDDMPAPEYGDFEEETAEETLTEEDDEEEE